MSLDTILSRQTGRRDEPVISCCIWPARGSSNGSRQDQRGGAVMKAATIIGAVEGVTEKWAKQRKPEEREASARRNRGNAMTGDATMSRSSEAAWQIMGRPISRPAPTARCRLTPGRSCTRRGPTSRQSPTATSGRASTSISPRQLLPEYIERTGVDWNVVYDARGHFIEPHTEHEVPLGTLQVGEYLDEVRGYEPPRARLRTVGRAASRPSVRAIAMARSCSSRKRASCRYSRR